MFQTQKNVLNMIGTVPFSSANSKALLTMQLRKKRRPWTAEEKNLSLTLFYKSPAAYNFLKLQNVNLLGTSSIRRLIGKSKFLPGFNKIFLNHIKKKFEFQTIKERKCTVCFDQLSIKECLEFSKRFNFIEGFEDFGKFGRTSNVANNALVFMARGIHSVWQIPVAYYLAHSAIQPCMLKDLLVHVLQTLFEIGLQPKLIVCDQDCSNNWSALKLLNVTENKPFFFINNKKVYAIFDVPRLVKSVRNDLIGCSFQKGEKTFCYSDIEETYKIHNRNYKNSVSFKITDAHINPKPFQKNSVKLALQVFSNTMASTIRTYCSTNELISDTAENTADFIDFINTLFDCLNSRSLYSENNYNCALSDANCVKQFLLDASSYFVHMFKRIDKGEITYLSHPSCFDGFTQTVKGVLSFFEDEKKDNTEHLLTSRLNQDIIVDLFTIICQKRGRDQNPTARVLRTSFRKTAIYSLVSSSKDVICELSQDYMAGITKLMAKNQTTRDKFTENGTKSFSSEYLSLLSSNGSNENLKRIVKVNVTSEHCTIVYFSGYLAHINMKKFDCNNCRLELLTDTLINDKDQLLIINKLFSCVGKIENEWLQSPSQKLVDLVNCALNIIEDKFVKVQHKKNINLIFMIWFKKCNLIKEWLCENEECVEHKNMILDKLITCKILKNCKDYCSINN